MAIEQTQHPKGRQLQPIFQSPGKSGRFQTDTIGRSTSQKRQMPVFAGALLFVAEALPFAYGLYIQYGALGFNKGVPRQRSVPRRIANPTSGHFSANS